MTTTPTAPAKPQGQWAVDGRTPLNANEVLKQEDDGLNVRAAHRDHLRQGGLRLDPARGPHRAHAVVGPVHAAQAGDRRRQDRDARARGARGRVLHDAGALGRRPPDARAAAHHRDDLHRVRARHGRHLRPAEHPAALDPHRGRAGDLASARVRRPVDRRGLRRRAARHPRLARRRRRDRRDHRRHPRDRRDPQAPPARPAVLQPARASSSPPSAGPRSSTSRTRSTTSRSSAWSTPSTGPASTCGSAAGCRRTRTSPCGSARGCRSTRCPTCGPASSPSSATTATAGCAPRPG